MTGFGPRISGGDKFLMENSKIEWTDHTFNPWIGCTKVSPGCLHCYAETLNQRWNGGANWGPGAPRRRTSPANWNEPRRWNAAAKTKLEKEFLGPDARRPRVFSASLADWLDHEIPIETFGDFLQLVWECQFLDWLLLTKRPRAWRSRLEDLFMTSQTDEKRPREFWTWIAQWLAGNAPSNVWAGTTAEDQDRYEDRIPWICCIPAVVRFLSCEPLLGPVNLHLGENRRNTAFVTRDAIQWIIVGGESGPGARPMHPDWARSLHAQCTRGGIAFFFKQWGEHDVIGKKVGKLAAGKELDGQILHEFPA